MKVSSFRSTSSPFKGSRTNFQSLEVKLEAQRTSSVISLDDHCIGDEGCIVLAGFLNKYTTVTDLELKGNNIGGAGITALSNVIRNNFTLRSISLGWNNLGMNENGLQNFFNALAENRSIQKVDLNNNEIGPEIASYIANCLKTNQSLQTIDLRWNRIGNTGGKAILKGLNVNKSLQILELAGNKVSDDIIRQLNDFLVRNKNGDFKGGVSHGQTVTQTTFKSYQHEPSFIRTVDTFVSPTKRNQISASIDEERQRIQENRVNLAKDLEQETKKRLEAEEYFQKLKEEFLRMELEESRTKSELQSRIDQLEQEKQSLQLRLLRVGEQFEKGDNVSKEK